MKVIFTSILFFTTIVLFAQQESTDKNNSQPKIDKIKKLGSLFKHKDTISFAINANINAIIKDRSTKEINNHSGFISMLNKDGVKVAFPVSIQTRGNFRKAPYNCDFPPLWLNFSKGGKSKTPFNNQDRLKLVTHCLKEEYVRREYSIYQIYELISDVHFKTRLCNVTYIDTVGKRAAEIKSAFLIESDGDLAFRNDMVERENVKVSQASVDSLGMLTIAVFQYMIGNTDWSVPGQHNIKIFIKDKKKAIAVPYDFDHAGLVSASYAKPPEILGISSVEERIYRGIDYPSNLYYIVFEKFKDSKESILKIYEDEKNFSEDYRIYAKEYIEEFFEKLSNPDSLIQEMKKTAMASLKKD